MSKKKNSYSAKIRKNLKKEGIVIDPLLDGLLEELERLETIRNSLYKAFTDADQADQLFKEYTNKGGATNLVLDAAVKEYKMYSQRFNDVIKTLEKMIKDRSPEKPIEDDPLEELNRRDAM